MSIFLISLGKRAKCWIFFLKRAKANFFRSNSTSHLEVENSVAALGALDFIGALNKEYLK